MDWTVHRHSTVTSTMDVAASLALEGAPPGTVVVADLQTAGRGRAGRAWRAPAGTALQLTALLRPDLPADRLGPLPLVVGVAVAEACEAVVPGPRVALKWPNDLLADGRKLGGVLITTRATVSGRAVLIGVGVNVTTSRADLPHGATSLAADTGVSRPTVAALLAAVLDRIGTLYHAFETGQVEESLDAWRSRAAWLGERVSVVDGGHERHGVFAGIDADGALLLRDDDGETHRIVAGDLTRGPRPVG